MAEPFDFENGINSGLTTREGNDSVSTGKVKEFVCYRLMQSRVIINYIYRIGTYYNR